MVYKSNERDEVAHNQSVTRAQFDHEEMNNIFKTF